MILHNVYRDFFRDMLAIPVVIGRKTKKERFAGATNTMTCEGMMRDGKALQMATSHELGQTFARAFDITYTDDGGAEQYAWTTSWGSSTRMVGGLIMAQGDDDGLRLPPRIAPIQAVVIVVREDANSARAATDLVETLKRLDVRARLDADVSRSFGRRVTDWELKGVPLRIEIGPRELAQGQITLARRNRAEKLIVDIDQAPAVVVATLDQIQDDMLTEAEVALKSHLVDSASLDEARDAAESGFARLPYAQLGDEGEDALARSGVTVRCIQRADGSVPLSEGEPDLYAIVARAY
jgi:prolyl-tRNA synthetase